MWLDYLGNAVIYYMRKIPLMKLIANRASYRQSKSLHAYAVIGIIVKLIWMTLKAALLVGLFVVLPRTLFLKYMPAGENGFGVDNCFVYFTLVMICFAGRLNHSYLFDVTKKSVTYLKTVKLKPKYYFHSLLIEKLAMEYISYTIVFSVFGMHWYKALYLSLLVILSHFIGEAIQIQVFHITGKRLTDLKAGTIFVTLLALFCAYFIPYIRGYVPAAYNLIFQTIWFMVIMFVASFFIYYVWNYQDYDELARVIHTNNYLMKEMGQPTPKTEPVSASAISEREHRRHMKRSPFGMSDYRYANWLFFKRNIRSVVHYIEIRAVIILIALGIALICNFMGYGKTVYRVIISSQPVTAFIMYVMTISTSVCKAMFSQGDRYLLHYGYYTRTADLIEHFMARLRMTTLLNMIPTALMIGAYALASYTARQFDSFGPTMHVCCTILVFGLAFSMLHLVIYYLAQPFNMKVEIKNPRFIVTTIIIMAACYGCIFIEVAAVDFLLGAVLFLGLVLAIGITLVWKWGSTSFSVYRK